MTTKVYAENTFNIADDLHGGGTVTVQHDAFIVSKVDNALEVFDGPWTFKIDGFLQSAFNGMAFYDDGITKALPNSKITVGTEGVIVNTGGAGNGFSGITSTQGLDVINSGLIQGTDYGIRFHDMAHSSSKTVSITNNAGGEIHGGTVGIEVIDTTHNLILKNQGIIDQVTWEAGSTIINSGTIESLDGQGGGTSINTLTNSGTITGYFVGSAGNDAVTNSGTIDEVLLQFGNNKVTNGGTISTTVSAGGGNDTVTNTGSIGIDVKLGDGTNKVTNGGDIGGLVKLGDGDDMITNSGSIGSDVIIGAGNNKITNSGTIEGKINSQGGVDTLINSKLISGAVDLGTGDAVLTNSGTIDGTLTLGSGHHKVTNSGDILSGVSFDSLGDVVTNSGLFGSKVDFLGSANNTFTNTGTIGSDLTMGGGNDVVKNSGHISGTVSLGGGDDTFIGGNARDQLSDGAGNDVYILGGGDDYLYWVGSGKDTIDGGAGTRDQFSASSVDGVFVNLDTKAVHFYDDLAASSAVTSTGSATIKGIEIVVGSSYFDVLAGSAGNDQLFGRGGGDLLYGGKGADLIDGGIEVDRFVYLSVTDSGNTKATRDTIEEFEGAGVSGGDVIDLSGIDANSKTTDNNEAFHLIGGSTGDVPFSGTTPGELRWVHELDTTIIQGDVNGDGKADFSIAVAGIVNFVDEDFWL